MRRIPSIHIAEHTLRYILWDFYGYDPLESPINQEQAEFVDGLVTFIMKKAKPHSLEKRCVTPNSKTSRKIEVKVSNDKSDYLLLANIIHNVRKDLKHKGIKPIDQNSVEYSQLKKLTPIINEFCTDFQMEKRAGYIQYVKAGLKKISSYRGYITKLIDMSESIALEQEAWQMISNDKTKTYTKQIHDYYVQKVGRTTGITESYDDKPIKYLHFIKVRELSMKYNVQFEDYIDSQFAGLEWTGSYPEPAQLVNEKAVERLNKYMYQEQGRKRLKIDDDIKVDKKLSNVLQRIKDGNYNDE